MTLYEFKKAFPNFVSMFTDKELDSLIAQLEVELRERQENYLGTEDLSE
jgi:hypothetical protein